MTRPMSEVLQVVLGHAEIASSLFIGVDNAHRYGDINKQEHDCADSMIRKFARRYDEQVLPSFTARKADFKEFIKECKENERHTVG